MLQYLFFILKGELGKGRMFFFGILKIISLKFFSVYLLLRALAIYKFLTVEFIFADMFVFGTKCHIVKG